MVERIPGSKYMATVPCPKSGHKKNACDYIGTIHMNSHKNWNTSNFYKHCRTHVKCTSPKSVYDYFSKASKNKNKQGAEDDQEDGPSQMTSRGHRTTIIDSDEETDNAEGHDIHNPDDDVDSLNENSDADFQKARQCKKKT